MLLLAESTVLGILAGWATGGSFARLRHAELRYESAFIVGLSLQALLPFLGEFAQLGTHEFIALWTLIAVVLLGIGLLNSQHVGMLVVSAGLVLNLLVIVPNGGMPVRSDARDFDGASARVVSSPLHVREDSMTVMPWLGDLIRIPGPEWHRYIVSIGDIVMLAGVSITLAQMMHSHTPES